MSLGLQPIRQERRSQCEGKKTTKTRVNGCEYRGEVRQAEGERRK